MKKIEATIAPHHLDAARDALLAAGADGMSITEVQGVAKQPRASHYRGASYAASFSPQLRLEVVVRDEALVGCVRALDAVAAEDDSAGGRIAVLPLDDIVHIRSGARGRNAI